MDYGLRDKGKEDMSGKLSIRPFPNLHFVIPAYRSISFSRLMLISQPL